MPYEDDFAFKSFNTVANRIPFVFIEAEIEAKAHTQKTYKLIQLLGNSLIIVDCGATLSLCHCTDRELY